VRGAGNRQLWRPVVTRRNRDSDIKVFCFFSEKKAFCSANRKTMRAFERPVSIGAARLIRHLDDYENV
jgi:hypothetical protein